MDLAPSEKEARKISFIANEIISKIKLKDATAILGGSGAKDTWLPNTHDIDIFVKFDYSKYENKSAKLADILYPALKRKFKKIARLHGSRDYFQFKYHGYNIEVIPILEINNYKEAKNITDISPLHISWVNSNINNLANDIRLAKQFCRANNLYGAESYIKGFSGYVLEILVIYCGSFINLLKVASDWKAKEVVDFYKVHKDPFASLNLSKVFSPLIVIDPVQPDRNAAAALSAEKYEKFRHLAKEYLKTKSDSFFMPKPLTKQSISRKFKHNQVIMLYANKKKGKPDVVGAKVLKAFNIIRDSLEMNEFKIVNADIKFNSHAVMYYILDRHPLSKYTKHYGPPIDKTEHLAIFKKKWKSFKIKQEGNRVYINVKRQYTNPLTLVKKMIKSKQIKPLVSSIKIA